MGVTKLRMFAGEAEVMGEIRSFHYDSNQGVLVIQGVATVGEAMNLLEELSSGALSAVAVPEEQGFVQEDAPPPAKNGKTNGAHLHVPQGYVKPDLVAGQPETPKPGALANAAVEAAKAELAQEEAPPAEPELPEKVLHAKRMLDVVSFFHAKGITDADGITAECEKLRTVVPLLGRVSDMRERVERTLVSYFQESNASVVGDVAQE